MSTVCGCAPPSMALSENDLAASALETAEKLREQFDAEAAMRREAEAANKEAREKTEEAERRLAEIRAGGGDAESVTTQQLRLAEAKLRELRRVEATLEATTRPPAKLHVGRGDASVRTSRACRRASPSGRGRSRDDHSRDPDGRPPRNPRSLARRCLRRDRGGATPPPQVQPRSVAPIAGNEGARRQRRRPVPCCGVGSGRPSSPCLAPSRSQASSIRLPGRARRPTTTRRMKDGGEGNPVRVLLDMLPGRRKHRLDRARHAVHRRVIHADQTTERPHI